MEQDNPQKSATEMDRDNSQDSSPSSGMHSGGSNVNSANNTANNEPSSKVGPPDQTRPILNQQPPQSSASPVPMETTPPHSHIQHNPPGHPPMQQQPPPMHSAPHLPPHNQVNSYNL